MQSGRWVFGGPPGMQMNKDQKEKILEKWRGKDGEKGFESSISESSESEHSGSGETLSQKSRKSANVSHLDVDAEAIKNTVREQIEIESQNKWQDDSQISSQFNNNKKAFEDSIRLIDKHDN